MQQTSAHWGCPCGPLVTFDGSSRHSGGHAVAGGAAVVWTSPDAAGERRERGWVTVTIPRLCQPA
eukprot:79822-Alexandrium_andersonii.AAC.1